MTTCFMCGKPGGIWLVPNVEQDEGPPQDERLCTACVKQEFPAHEIECAQCDETMPAAKLTKDHCGDFLCSGCIESNQEEGRDLEKQDREDFERYRRR